VGVRSLALALLLLATPVWAAGKNPPAPRVTRSVVEARLKAYEPNGLSAWQSLGPGTDQALVEIGRDPKVDVLVRGRAVSALGYFPTPPARRFLEDMLRAKAAATADDDKLLLRKAAVALGWMAAREVPELLGPLLAHADPEVRVDAAIGLGLSRLAAAADLLRKRLDVEPVARVRSQIGRQLRVVEDASAARTP
jgi:HEAT repeat protein